MRIDRIHIDGFGRLAALDTGADPLAGFVVVVGPNEAGKSTLFAFLTTALYGFQPATREANPHVPWGSPEASGSVQLRLDQGGCAEIERRLRSHPSGMLTVSGSTRDLRNHPVPWVEHVPRSVFRQVFAITLAELAGLDGETWARIQDNVVGSMGASDLRSPRAVADILEKEAGEIWRPSRRGSQRLRDLQEASRELRGRRAKALERDERVRALVTERVAVQGSLDAARNERQRARATLERLQTLLPLKQQLDRVRALRSEGGDRALLDGLPADPPTRLASLESERDALRSQRAGLIEELEEHQATVASFDQQARACLSRRHDVALLAVRAAGCAPDRARVRELEWEISDLEARLHTAAARLLTNPWRSQAEALARAPIDVLKDRLARASVVPAGSVRPAVPRSIALSGLLIGGALLLWGISSGRPLVSALGASIVAIGAFGLASGRRAAADATRGTTLAARDDEALALLRGIDLQPAHRHLTEHLVSSLGHLSRLVRDREDLLRALALARTRIEQVDSAAALLARDLSLDSIGDADALAIRFDAELRRATGLEGAAAHAEREARRLHRESQAVDTALASLDASIAELTQKGAAFFPSDPKRGLAIAGTRTASHRRADELEAELQLRFSDLSELEAMVASTPDGTTEGVIDPGEVALARDRLESIEEEIERLARSAEGLEQNILHLRDLETVDAVDSEGAAIRETEARLARERDRKWVLARILREADRRFREEHQPDLLRRAGSYLAHLTGGRYDRLVVDEAESLHQFLLVGPGLPAPVPLTGPVSTGTLEQAYLALRLAIVDHLDRGGERLPLFVDEVFVNWDAGRRVRGLEVLGGMAETRQIFVFTCHADVAEELSARGAQVLALGPTG